jgi:hypothetical protein
MVDEVLSRMLIYGRVWHSMQTVLAHGGATGADALCAEFAERYDIPCKVFRADWKRLGVKAGPLRNAVMLDAFEPDVVIAFPGGRGTAHCVKIAKEKRIWVLTAAEVLGL